MASARNAPEATLIGSRLREAGIVALDRGNLSETYFGDVGPRDIYVEDADFDRAREVLERDEGMSEDELTRAADEGDAAERDRSESSK